MGGRPGVGLLRLGLALASLMASLLASTGALELWHRQAEGTVIFPADERGFATRPGTS